MHDAMFQQVDFGPLKQYLENDDITDISYSNGGQIWLKTLSKGIYRIECEGLDDAFMEKLAFQCANTMGKTFNMAAMPSVSSVSPVFSRIKGSAVT